jgi:hypothetical protein
MKLKICLMAIALLVFVPASSAITTEDLVGTYVGNWTESGPPNDAINRYEAVVVFEPDNRVTTYVFAGVPPDIAYGTGILLVEEDGSFVIGDDAAFGQVTLHGKHLRVLVHWPGGVTVEFKGHRSNKLPDWFPTSDTPEK